MPFGGSQAAVAIGAQHARQDWRVQMDRTAATSEGAARNRGARTARGRYLLFLSATDLLPPRGVEALVRSLEASRSDLAVGRVSDRGVPGPHLLPVYETSELARAAELRDVSTVIGDVRVGNRLFRSDYWRRVGLAFPEVGDALTEFTIARASLSATTLDVLGTVTLHDMRRGGGLVFGHQRNLVGDLDSWIAGARGIAADLASAGHAVEQAWLHAILDITVANYLSDAERTDESQWRTLAGLAEELMKKASEETLSRVRAESRIKLWLAAHDRRSDLEEFVSLRSFSDGQQPTDVREGMVYARLPYFEDTAAAVPDRLFALAESETALVSSLRGAQWVGGAELRLNLFLFIGYVDLQAGPPAVEAWLVDESSGNRVDVGVLHRADPAVTRFARHRHQNYDNGAVTLTIDVRRLLGQSDGRSRWRLDTAVTAGGVRRTGSVTHRVAQAMSDPLHARVVSGRRVTIAQDPHRGLELRVEPPGPVLESVALRSRTLTGRIEVPDHIEVASVLAHQQGRRPQAARYTPEDGSFVLKLRKSGPRPEPALQLLVVDTSGSRLPLGWPASEAVTWLGASAPAEWALHRTTMGDCEIIDARGTAIVQEISLGDANLRVRGRLLTAVPDGAVVELRGADVVARAQLQLHGDGFVVDLALTQQAWNEWHRPLPAGAYQLMLGTKRGDGRRPLLVGDELALLVDRDLCGKTHRVRPRRVGGVLTVVLSAPLDDNELGPYHQQSLRNWYSESDQPLDQGLAYLQSYTGESATDSPLAIHHELRRRWPDLQCAWGIADLAVPVPEGAVPILISSREWYSTLARARYLVGNIDFERWFAKRPGQ